jgi:2-polyprenyl-3-methyl-5-hydroxy-6-metoxy-1,4-benzoquinol methylase
MQTDRPLPRGADWSGLSQQAPHALNEQGMPTRVHYSGIPVAADGLDVHEQAMAILEEHVSDRSASILDVGAGAGAFAKRILDHDYRDVHALEVNRAAFQVEEVPVHVLDLDSDWSQQLPKPFDAVVSLEVIEHLENPWHFARQCAAAVRPGGVIVLSTPNIQSSRSRLQFLLNAEFRFFGEKDFQNIGHMTSLTKNQIFHAFTCAGCDFLDYGHSSHKGIPRPTSGRKLLRMLLYAVSYPFMRDAKFGEVSMFAFRKTR